MKKRFKVILVIFLAVLLNNVEDISAENYVTFHNSIVIGASFEWEVKKRIEILEGEERPGIFEKGDILNVSIIEEPPINSSIWEVSFAIERTSFLEIYHNDVVIDPSNDSYAILGNIFGYFLPITYINDTEEWNYFEYVINLYELGLTELGDYYSFDLSKKYFVIERERTTDNPAATWDYSYLSLTYEKETGILLQFKSIMKHEEYGTNYEMILERTDYKRIKNDYLLILPALLISTLVIRRRRKNS